MAPLAEDKGIRLARVAGPSAAVIGNRHLLAQAIANLVDNAVKYTPSGGRIAAGLTADGAVAVVFVTDDGPGIPAEERERATQRFVRLDASRSTPGNGLGLSLVVAVARLHGGRLVLSDNAPGLRAELRLPAAAPQSSGIA
ncbi:MAG: HAMP domain-containing histidine kinase [Alphaproteobacteria bacterium]|nr:HAMP domain-containing histidine kinase [Alphaproteobacteria bacterium]